MAQEETNETDRDTTPNADTADAFHTYLVNEYHRYRNVTVVMAILGFSLLFLTVALSQSGVLAFHIYNIMMTLSYLFIVLMAVFGFTRMRPVKKRMRDYENDAARARGEAVTESEDGVRMEKRALRDMDDFYKIFERGARTELIPPGKQYRKLRRRWLGVFIAAAVVALAAIGVYLAAPDYSVASSVMLVAAFILVIVAFYIDRTKMKPMRESYAREFNMTEFEARDKLL